MKRPLLLALLALALPAGARAVPITYDLSGTSIFRRATGLASDPTGFVDTPLSSGSTLVFDFDPDGDGVLRDATVVSSDMRVRETLRAFEGLEFEFTITTDLQIGFSGGQGWVYPGPVGMPTIVDFFVDLSNPDFGELTFSGSYRCEGPGCARLGLPEGDQPYGGFFGDTFSGESLLGRWQFYGSGSEFESDELFAEITRNPDGSVATGLWLHGRGVAEPSSIALLGATGVLLLARKRACRFA